MEFISIFNDVLGPVMRGPSSSHTAGSYRIARMARALLEDQPVEVNFTFDPEGSYAKTYREQGGDLGFAAGLLEWPLVDARFFQALEAAAQAGISLEFKIAPLKRAEHPNFVEVRLKGRKGKRLRLGAQSMGGGLIIVRQVEDWEVAITGKSHDLLLEFEKCVGPQIEDIVRSEFQDPAGFLARQSRQDLGLFHYQSALPWKEETLARLRNLPGLRNTWVVSPVFFVKRGEALFASSKEMVSLAQHRRLSLGQAALEYESTLLGLAREEVKAEMLRRWEVMRAAVDQGLRGEGLRMKLLEPSAGKVFLANAEGTLAVGGLHVQAAARAMAALHVSSSGGVVCAAPTGASSGVIPGVMATLAQEKSLSPEQVVMSLFAASAVGLFMARRATFAAETAGCQVEIGAAGAMAAAAVVEAAGGTARQAVDAAAISLQNTMGSVCDLVQGICEIPCHTRNAVAASSAFICADLILGGYDNAIPLDETIDAVYSVGRMLPPELRCTSGGGIALAPSASSLPRRS